MHAVRRTDRLRTAAAAPGRFRMLPIVVVVASLGAAAHSATAWAQSADAVRLTLAQAQARAAAASHRLAESLARADAARAAADVRAAARRPLVAATAGYTRTNHVTEFVVPTPTGQLRVLYPDVPDNYRSRLDLQWPIYTGGRADALERAARAEADASTADAATAQADLRLEVARSFWAVVTGSATVGVLEQGVARAAAHVQDARARLDSGLVPPNEVASAEAQAARQRMLLIEARGQRDVAAAEFNRLVGADAAQSFEPDADLDERPPELPSVTVVLGEAQRARPERVALERRIAAADEARAAAVAGRKPTVSIAGGVDYARPNPRIFPRADRWDESWDAGVNVAWPLWDGGRTSAELAQAASLATAARQRLAEFDALLAVDVRGRVIELQSGLAAVTAAEEAVRAATEAHRVVQQRYQAGVVPEIEVLDAQFALLQAELDRTRAAAGVRLAESRLARVMGR